ncbi:hypothetical protein A6R68_24137, partial [Neotoma lepida]
VNCPDTSVPVRACKYKSVNQCKTKVLMKDIATPIPAEEVKKVVRKCLEKAALINYTRLTEYAKIE